MKLHISNLVLKEKIQELNIENELTLCEVFIRISNISHEFKAKIFDAEEKIIKYKHINIYVNGHDIRFINNLDTKIKNEDHILIIPPVMGG